MSSETLKTRLRAGQVAIGAWLTTSSAEVAEIMAAQGFDWLAVDMEHGSAGVNEAFGAFRAAERWGWCPSPACRRPIHSWRGVYWMAAPKGS